MRTLARQSDKEDILRRLRTVQPDSTPRWGRMSAHQMVCHLADSFRMAAGQKHTAPRGAPLERTILKTLVLYMPLRWPHGILTSPEIDQDQGGTRPVDFASDVAQVEALLARVTTQTGTLGREPHPVFGPMSRAQWLRWGYLHTDHHLRQFGA